jgi:hypothetical protein
MATLLLIGALILGVAVLSVLERTFLGDWRDYEEQKLSMLEHGGWNYNALWPAR